MKSREIRQVFLDFFRKKGHEVLPGSPLLPKEDPTILFTNAGMNQFKTVFLGDETRAYKRAVTVQKCLRAGGKHNDLENVGRTARHHTFFEMLGNFSFGDYFKKEAILWAWEFLTEQVSLPAEKLLISVYEKDDDAASLWQKEAGIPQERIFRMGEKDNFWQMGDTGPCGPCSEILIDQGPATGCGRPGCSVGCDCDRFLEIWNLVFMQYNRDTSGKLSPLPKPSIDTGMGIERLSAVLQGKKNNFDSDLFMPVIGTTEEISGKTYGTDPLSDVSLRVIADHIRAAAFVLAEGLTPSNEGRGYVLRRIIRRASRHGLMLGIQEPFLYNVIDTVHSIMSEPYPELLEDAERSRKVLRHEEERFMHTLSAGMTILNRIMENLKAAGKDTVPGAELFKLYDTYGFPLDLAQDIAGDSGLRIDQKGFNDEMDRQRTRARASWVGEDEVSGTYREIKKKTGPTKFVGYETTRAESRVIALIREGTTSEEVREGQDVEIILDTTPFYGESGGQVGDRGILKSDGARIEVLDTKSFSDMMIHIAVVRKGSIRTGQNVSAIVDVDRRKSIRRNHTATHLLQSALRAVLGDHIKQAGSLVEPDRLRFDFTHFFAMDERERSEVEHIVNEKILENLPVHKSVTTLDDALAKGATALFGEKYGENVRVVKAGDFSAELCGGTHCDATGEIGVFKILSEGSVAAGIRRIEAITGLTAVEFFRARESELKKAAGLLKVPETMVAEKVEKTIRELKQYEKDLDKTRKRTVTGNTDTILNSAVEVGGIKVLAYKTEGFDMKTLRDLADTLKDRMGSGVLLLASASDGQAYYVSAVTKDLTGQFHAGDILREVTGGKGGGRADMAQGGTRDIAGISKAVTSLADIIKAKVNP